VSFCVREAAEHPHNTASRPIVRGTRIICSDSGGRTNHPLDNFHATTYGSSVHPFTSQRSVRLVFHSSSIAAQADMYSGMYHGCR
jgi:hypothetical protein